MAKYAAYGTVVKRSGTTIIQAQDIQGPELTAEALDATAHDSTAAWREFVAGLIDGGEVAFTLFFDPDAATHTSIRTDLVARLPVAHSVTFPDTTPAVASFSAIVTRFKPMAPVAGMLTAEVTIKVTGAVSWA